jgi:Carboxypeptidase regulatory-like domain
VLPRPALPVSRYPGYPETATTLNGAQIAHQALPQVTIGTIAGRVTNSSGTGLEKVQVRVGTAEAVTDSSGAYSMLAPVGSYQVCFDAIETPKGSTPNGYNSPCRSAVGVTRGATTRVDQTLLADGSITGRVVQADGSAVPQGEVTVFAGGGYVAGGISGTVTTAAAALSRAEVKVFRADGSLWGSASTDDAGHYSVVSLPAGVCYTVCVDPTNLNINSHHYTPRCYRNVAWSGDSDNLPSGTTPVPVTGAADHPKVDVTITEP